MLSRPEVVETLKDITIDATELTGHVSSIMAEQGYDIPFQDIGSGAGPRQYAKI